MPEQITYYHDPAKMSPFCHRVEMALVEAGAPYTAYAIDPYNKPAWFAQANPLTGKIPAITYGGPDVPPDAPSPLSFKLTESTVLLEFLADLFPTSTLLPPASDPMARARVRFFIDVVLRDVEKPMFETSHRVEGAFDRMTAGLKKIQAMLPDPDTAGEYAMGKAFTNADIAIVPVLAYCHLAAETGLGRFEHEVGEKLKVILEGGEFDRLRRYQKALWERESVKKVVDLEHMESQYRARLAGRQGE